MADMNISLDQANNWVSKVEAEIVEVNKVLNKTTAYVKECTDEVDTLEGVIRTTMNSYESAWHNLESGYQKVIQEIRAAFDLQSKAVDELVQKVKQEAQKAKA